MQAALGAAGEVVEESSPPCRAYVPARLRADGRTRSFVVKTPPPTGVLIGISANGWRGRRKPGEALLGRPAVRLSRYAAGLPIVELVSQLDHLQAQRSRPEKSRGENHKRLDDRRGADVAAEPRHPYSHPIRKRAVRGEYLIARPITQPAAGRPSRRWPRRDAGPGACGSTAARSALFVVGCGRR